MHRIIVAGHSCVDLIPLLEGPIDPAPGAFADIGPLSIRAGGSVVNTGRALVQLGHPVGVVTTVGDDALGEILRGELEMLSPLGVVETVPDVGTSYSIVLEHQGSSRTIWHHAGSAAGFTGAAVDPAGAGVVHLGYLPTLPGLVADDTRPLQQLLQRVRAADATVSIDMSTVPRTDGRDWVHLLAPVLPAVDVFTPSADDLVSIGWLPADPSPADIAAGAARLLEAGVGIAMITDGERGGLLAVGDAPRLARGGRVLNGLGAEWPEHRIAVEVERVERVVTTNGAGDAATAGLLFALVNGYAPAEAGRLAARVAARRIGGDPTDDEEDGG